MFLHAVQCCYMLHCVVEFCAAVLYVICVLACCDVLLQCYYMLPQCYYMLLGVVVRCYRELLHMLNFVQCCYMLSYYMLCSVVTCYQELLHDVQRC